MRLPQDADAHQARCACVELLRQRAPQLLGLLDERRNDEPSRAPTSDADDQRVDDQDREPARQARADRNHALPLDHPDERRDAHREQRADVDGDQRARGPCRAATTSSTPAIDDDHAEDDQAPRIAAAPDSRADQAPVWSRAQVLARERGDVVVDRAELRGRREKHDAEEAVFRRRCRIPSRRPQNAGRAQQRQDVVRVGCARPAASPAASRRTRRAARRSASRRSRSAARSSARRAAASACRNVT